MGKDCGPDEGAVAAIVPAAGLREGWMERAGR
jgi:hypothetical protein